MESLIENAPCCVVTGFGRSGTSLIASLLQSAGLDIGSRLLGSGEGNQRGHFEDMDMLTFHMQVLAANGLNTDGFLNPQSISVSEEHLAQARNLVGSRLAGARPWGWKEPRTVLFLDFWKRMIPELHYLFLFRCPWEVLDSLFRRGDPLFQANPKLAIEIWMGYNKAILDYCDHHPGSCLLVEAQAAADDPYTLIDVIESHFGIGLNRPGNLYEKDLLQHKISSAQRSLFLQSFPEAVRIYEELRSKAILTLNNNQRAIEDVTSARSDSFLRFWVDCRVAEKQSRRAEAEVQRVHTELEESQAAAGRELSTARCQLAEMHVRLKELEHGQEIVEQELHAARCEADVLRHRLGEMENSRIWKLRNLWVNFHNPKRVPV